MKMDTLGDRMKGYEDVTKIKMPRRLPMIIRIDGKAFHTMTKKWRCEKPYDDRLMNYMADTTKYLCENIQGCVLGYTQSDEISLLVRDDQSLTSDAYFDKKLQKIVSVTASMTTMKFNSIDTCGSLPGAMFDARAYVLPSSEVTNYFIWRQQDATRNSVSMLAQSLYSHKKLQGLKRDKLMDLCMEKGQNWNDVPTQAQRGTCVIKIPTVFHRKENDNTLTDFTRMKWEIDQEIPIFTEDRDYINDLL